MIRAFPLTTRPWPVPTWATTTSCTAQRVRVPLIDAQRNERAYNSQGQVDGEPTPPQRGDLRRLLAR